MNEPGKKKQEGIEKFGKWVEGGLRQTIISLPPFSVISWSPVLPPPPSFECADFHRRGFSGKLSPKEKMCELGHAPASPVWMSMRPSFELRKRKRRKGKGRGGGEEFAKSLKLISHTTLFFLNYANFFVYLGKIWESGLIACTKGKKGGKRSLSSPGGGIISSRGSGGQNIFGPPLFLFP